MKDFIEFIAKQLVDNPDKVSVEEISPDDNTIELKLRVDKNDIGKVIGKKGRTISAMRILLTAVGAKGKHRVTLEVIEWISESQFDYYSKINRIEYNSAPVKF